jgi:uncharacterized membrane protein
MMSRASFRKHPIHPMLIVFPIGLWVFSLVCDLIYHGGSYNPFWKQMAFYTMAGGVIGALLAAIPGFIDFLSIRDRRTRQIATVHMVLNLIVVVLFIFNLGMRYSVAADPDSQLFGTILSVSGIFLMAISGWLGGSLVYIHHVGVETAGKSTERDRRAA